ncbi:Uncharacterised protein [Vibrio cholerae]|nr:Uncharacterised protein [Vibrio cholerae]
MNQLINFFKQNWHQSFTRSHGRLQNLILIFVGGVQ